MTTNPPAVLRSALYALRGGFLIRPFVIAFLLATAGAVLSAIEEQYPAIQAIVPWTLFPSRADPQVVQAILTTIATATMTVVSIVFAPGGVLQEETSKQRRWGLRQCIRASAGRGWWTAAASLPAAASRRAWRSASTCSAAPAMGRTSSPRWPASWNTQRNIAYDQGAA